MIESGEERIENIEIGDRNTLGNPEVGPSSRNNWFPVAKWFYRQMSGSHSNRRGDSAGSNGN